MGLAIEMHRIGENSWKQVIKMIPNDDISLDELSDSETERL